MNCADCHRRTPRADLHHWTIKPCADSNRKRVFLLCPSCDVALNRRMLELAGDKRVDEKMARYSG